MRYKGVMLFMMIALFYGELAAQHKAKRHHHKTVESSNDTQYEGIASYYSDKFNGRKTASGEIFSQDKYTAACNVLPLGTYVLVTNLSNGKCVKVKINDRIGLHAKRIIDLSKIAASELSFLNKGLTKVKVEVVKD